MRPVQKAAITGALALETGCDGRIESRPVPILNGGWSAKSRCSTLTIRTALSFAFMCSAIFHSVRYVELWRKLLARHPSLNVYGYSARWDVKHDPIAAALASLAADVGWRRFAMRFSDAPSETRSTVSVEHPYQAPRDAIVCPEQIGRTEVVLDVRAVLAIGAEDRLCAALGF